MTDHKTDERPAAAFAGIGLDLKPLMGVAGDPSGEPPAPAAPHLPRAMPGAGGGPIAVGELISLTESLADVMRKETEALRRMDMTRFQELSERKVGLANSYATLMWRMRRSPDVLRALPAPDRDSLRLATERMRHASHDNETAVRGAQEASQILMNAIARAAQSRRPNAGTYGANGRAGYSPSAAGHQSSAIFQDTVL